MLYTPHIYLQFLVSFIFWYFLPIDLQQGIETHTNQIQPAINFSDRHGTRGDILCGDLPNPNALGECCATRCLFVMRGWGPLGWYFFGKKQEKMENDDLIY